MRLVSPSALHENEGELVDLMTAATRLGISYDGVRRRIARGKLRSIKREGHVLVVLPSEPDRTPPDNTPDTAPNSPPDGADQPAGQPADGSLRELVETLREENRRLWSELEVRTEELRRKDHIIAALAQRPLGLPPGTTLAAPTGVPDAHTHIGDQPVHRPLPLWRRLWLALVSGA